MRRCKIAPSACARSDRPCCADCMDKICQARCLNDQKLYGCWEAAPDPSSRKDSRRLGPKPRVDRDEIVRLHNEGLAQYQIALRLKCSQAQVSRILKEMRVTRHGPSDMGK